MNPFNNPLAVFYLFIGFVALIATVINFRQERNRAILAKLSPFEVAVRKGFVGTEDEWTSSLTRRERRQLQFADQTPDEVRERAHKAQERFYKEFRAHLDAAVISSNMPFIEGVRNILAIAEREMKSYRARAHKQDLSDDNVSLNDLVFGTKVCDAIVYYASRCRVTDMGCIGMDLMRFVEAQFRVRHLNGVLYRNKGTVSHSMRCNAMAHSIIKYFQSYSYPAESFLVPFDYLPIEWLTANEELRRTFFQQAVDGTYRDMMKAAEKNPFSKTERLRNKEHENNRKQRRRRVTKSKNRN